MLRNALPKVITDTLPGPKAKALIERREQTIPSAIKNIYPATIKRGEGAMFEDLDGNIFLDWCGGVGVLNIGYSHPELVEAVKEQADKYFHAMFNVITHEGYVELSEKLSKIVPVKGDKKRTFFANSGAEGVENAIKLAKAFTKRPNIIVFTAAFHGRTSLTMTMSSRRSLARGQGAFPAGVFRAEYPDMYHAPAHLNEEEQIAYFVQSIKDRFEDGTLPETTAAIVIEPILGDGGSAEVPIAWVKEVRKICDEHGIMLIADEIQCGWGRSGKLFVSDYWKEAGAAPDIICTAKSMAGGMPISAIIAREEIMESVPGGVVGGTYGGNAVACASALKVLEVMEKDDLPGRAARIGESFKNWYQKLEEKFEVVGNLNGRASMVGIEFVKDRTTKEPATDLVNAIVQECIQNGLLIQSSGRNGNVIRFLAPLVMTDSQLYAGFDILEKAIETCISK